MVVVPDPVLRLSAHVAVIVMVLRCSEESAASNCTPVESNSFPLTDLSEAANVAGCMFPPHWPWQIAESVVFSPARISVRSALAVTEGGTYGCTVIVVCADAELNPAPFTFTVTV